MCRRETFPRPQPPLEAERAPYRISGRQARHPLRRGFVSHKRAIRPRIRISPDNGVTGLSTCGCCNYELSQLAPAMGERGLGGFSRVTKAAVRVMSRDGPQYASSSPPLYSRKLRPHMGPSYVKNERSCRPTGCDFFCNYAPR